MLDDIEKVCIFQKKKTFELHEYWRINSKDWMKVYVKENSCEACGRKGHSYKGCSKGFSAISTKVLEKMIKRRKIVHVNPFQNSISVI